MVEAIANNMKYTSFLFFFLLLSCKQEKTEIPQPFTETEAQKQIRRIMEKAAVWQLNNLAYVDGTNGWGTSVFYIGLMAAYQATGDEKYMLPCLWWSAGNNWEIKQRPRNADDQNAGQVYTELYLTREEKEKWIADIKQAVDQMVAEPKPGWEDWFWCDALFMAPPVFARLGKITDNQAYYDLLNVMWWDVVDFLYDHEDHLFYRDKYFIGRLNENEKKIFWSRGNGWVMGGLVRVMQYLPEDHPDYSRYVVLLQNMAEAVTQWQRTDGLWHPNLVDPQIFPTPETSGSALITYALTWGLNQGYLNKEKYLPIIEKAWQGLIANVSNDGKLGWMQGPAARPGATFPDETHIYGTGALLLAASEMYKLNN